MQFLILLASICKMNLRQIVIMKFPHTTNSSIINCVELTIFIFGNRFRSSLPEVFLGKGFLKICSKFTEEHPCRSAISITLLGMGVLLYICCIFSEQLFLRTPLGGCFCRFQVFIRGSNRISDQKGSPKKFWNKCKPQMWEIFLGKINFLEHCGCLIKILVEKKC